MSGEGRERASNSSAQAGKGNRGPTRPRWPRGADGSCSADGRTDYAHRASTSAPGPLDWRHTWPPSDLRGDSCTTLSARTSIPDACNAGKLPSCRNGSAP
eukprot:4195353-Pyramimonas_sp.AAC.1